MTIAFDNIVGGVDPGSLANNPMLAADSVTAPLSA